MSANSIIPKVLGFGMSPLYNLGGTFAAAATGNFGLSRWTNVKCCFRLLQSRGKSGSPKLTPHQVSAILRANEWQLDLSNSATSVHGIDTNQLPSNQPIEDRRAEARCLQTSGSLFGVFDGHAGFACAEVISRRLFRYVAAALLPPDALRSLAQRLSSNQQDEDPLLEWYNPPAGHLDNLGGFSAQLSDLYRQSFVEFVDELQGRRQDNYQHHHQDDSKMADALCRAFLRLDGDLWREVERCESDTTLLAEALAVATSGAVACVAHLDGAHLHVASTGDCAAVLGTRGESGETWVARPLTRPHSYENSDEERRVRSEHPASESETVIRQERLLGQLAPFRAFGDSAFKQSSAALQRLFAAVGAGKKSHRLPPPGYHTPPYLTALPEVSHHRLTPRDRFLVLASDGLWEQVAPSRVVQLVGEYMQGRKTLEPFRLRGTVEAGGGRQRKVSLGEVNRLLDKRREGLELKPVDANAATHLLRSALGDTEYGVDHQLLSQMLSAPRDVVRLIRDDISIVIVFFNKDFIRRHPS